MDIQPEEGGVSAPRAAEDGMEIPIQHHDEEDIDEDEDEDDEVDPNHQLLDRVQRALYEQLSKRKEALEIKIRDRKEAVSRIVKQREQTGVELYGFQQQLAKLQQDLESKHDFMAQNRETRKVAEKRVKYLEKVVEDATSKKDLMEKKRLDEQKKLDEIRITVKQIEEHNNQLKGEIKVTRRAAIGTEVGMKEAEKEKREQDILIDELNEKIKSIAEEMRLYVAQIASQQKQTELAKTTLAEAEKEIKDINIQKREYIQRWKTSLTGMKRRDESLQITQAALQKLQEQRRGVEVEIIGLKKNISEEQEKNERLTAIQTKLETELKFLESQNENVVEDIKVKQDSFEKVQISLNASEDHLKKEKLLAKRGEDACKQIHKQIEKLAQKRQQLENKIELELKGEIDTLKRGKKGVAKGVIKLRADIQKKDLEIADTRNELARVRVDILNTTAFHKQLESTLKEYEAELAEKDKIINKYESELKATSLKIERKQIYIARLNKKYDELTANDREENTGPLEATIKTLKRDIEHFKTETAHQQRKWIGLQNTLVNLAQETGQIDKKSAEMRSRISVLEQKNLRVKSQTKHEQNEGKALNTLIRHLHFDAKKLNDMIAKSEILAKEISSSNYTAEQDFANELKSLSDASKARQEKIQALKTEKEETIQKVIEAEKMVMLMEKKIQLERETHAAIDPEFGQPEIKGMKKEIHRMEIRLTQLKKHQEMMIQQMERSIQRRQMIQMGHEASKGKGESKINLRKKISALKNALKANMREFKKVELLAEDAEAQGKDIQANVDIMAEKLGALENDKLDLEHELQTSKISRRINENKLLLLERKKFRAREILRKKEFTQADYELGTMGLAKEEEIAKKINKVLLTMGQNYPKFGEYMEQIQRFLLE